MAANSRIAVRYAADCRQRNPAPFLGAQTVVAACHGHACRYQPLDVPLEWTGQRLVEVVEIKDQPPFRGGERSGCDR